MSGVLEIAGVKIVLSCPDAMTSGVLPDPYPLFWSSASPSGGGRRVGVDVEVVEDLGPPFEEATFETEGSWRLGRADGGHLVEMLPFWRAEIDKGFDRALVHCGPDLVGDGSALTNPLCYLLDTFLMINVLAREEGLLLHAAGVVVDGRGVLFLGVSGAGKTTVAGQFAGDPNCRILSDDRICVRRLHGVFRAFGTPWPGSGDHALNASAPLAAVFFVEKGEATSIRDLSPSETVERLMPVASVPWYFPDVVDGCLAFCEALAHAVPTMALSFRREGGAPGAVRAALDGVGR